MKKLKMLLYFMLTVLVICFVFIMYINSNYYSSKMLVKAISSGDKIKVLEILQKNPNCVNTYPSIAPDWWQSLMNQSIGYPLVEACRTGDIELVEILVESGADVNLGARFTPLSLTYHQKPENWYYISLYLIKHGALLDYKASNSEENVLTDIVGSRPGSMTEKYGREKNEEVVLSFYYVLEKCDHTKINWMRVLQHCITSDRIDLVKFLLDEDYCDVNDTSFGITALMFATRDSTPEMVQLLLSYGADKTYKSSDGKTAYDYAIESKNKDIISMLD